MRRPIGAAVALAALALLWLGYDWLITPGTYRLPATYLAVVAVAACLHVLALRRFHRMYVTIRRAESDGHARPGSTLFAVNQRFRYAARVLESTWFAGLGVILIAEVSHPTLGTHKAVGWFLIVYLIGSVALTGYLTFRDLRVVTLLRQLDTGRSTAAELQPFREDPST